MTGSLHAFTIVMLFYFVADMFLFRRPNPFPVPQDSCLSFQEDGMKGRGNRQDTLPNISRMCHNCRVNGLGREKCKSVLTTLPIVRRCRSPRQRHAHGWGRVPTEA